jgi:hypothetical protein
MSAYANHAARHHAARASERKAVSAFWAKADKHSAEKLEAAKAILETPASIAQNGGEGSAVVSWARLALVHAAERMAAL